MDREFPKKWDSMLMYERWMVCVYILTLVVLSVTLPSIISVTAAAWASFIFYHHATWRGLQVWYEEPERYEEMAKK